jgi:hypothetical protein
VIVRGDDKAESNILKGKETCTLYLDIHPRQRFSPDRPHSRADGQSALKARKTDLKKWTFVIMGLARNDFEFGMI